MSFHVPTWQDFPPEFFPPNQVLCHFQFKLVSLFSNVPNFRASLEESPNSYSTRIRTDVESSHWAEAFQKLMNRQKGKSALLKKRGECCAISAFDSISVSVLFLEPILNPPRETGYNFFTTWFWAFEFYVIARDKKFTYEKRPKYLSFQKTYILTKKLLKTYVFDM